MKTKIKVARFALLGALAVFILGAIGCGSSGDSDAGQNVKPVVPQNVKPGRKHDPSSFLSPE